MCAMPSFYAQSRAKPLMPVQLPRADRKPDHHLVIDLSAPDIQMLRREIDRHRVGNLVLHALEDRDLPLRAAGLLPQPIGVNGEMSKCPGRRQPVTIARADIEGPARVRVGRMRRGGPRQPSPPCCCVRRHTARWPSRRAARPCRRATAAMLWARTRCPASRRPSRRRSPRTSCDRRSELPWCRC